jgi:hypothetical protein
MTAPVIVKYPLDLTGTLPSNLVQGETVRVPRTTGRHFVPQNGPFFEDSMVIHTVPDNRLLVKDVDYNCLYLYEYASVKAGQSVVAVVSIINPEIHGDLTYDYQVIGGEFSNNVSAIHLLIENLAIDNRVISWDNILDRPVTFPPSPHLHDVGDWYGMDHVVEAIINLTTAISVGSVDLYDQLNVRFDALFALYQAQQLSIGAVAARVTTVEDRCNGFDVFIANITAQFNQFKTYTEQYIKFTPIATNFTAGIDRRYIVTSNVTITLPNTVGLTPGQSVELEFRDTVVCDITVFNTASQVVRRRGVTDTTLRTDGVRPRLLFIYLGSNIWEVRV